VKTYGGRVWEVCALLDDDSAKPPQKGSSKSKSRQHCKPSELGQRLVPGFPYIQAEVVYACQEYACTVEDVLSRRTRLSFLNKQAALDALPLVAQIMSRELGWTKAVTLAQTQAARQYIDSYGGRVRGDVTHAATVLSDNNHHDMRKVSFAEDRNKGWLYRLTAATTSGLRMTSMQRPGQRRHPHAEEEEEEGDTDDEQQAA
jgi:C-terminal domain of alpha-glycerophosphate oxidase